MLFESRDGNKIKTLVYDRYPF